ncbi:Calvin cycle protein CP12 [Mastigocladopsis repens]|uniref:Calvin cycle protein CP12 n=1 Tax=Mastigocladopsis repens TaxID=221287 RepID=UPI0002FF4E8D|nr:Calvin cycle protein CP12 [Mastigocladopsis repens]
MPNIIDANQKVANQSPLEQAIEQAIEQARATCDIQGNNSAGCAVAWDIVEELQAEKSHRQATEKFKTSLDLYCDENPNAPECLIYDV